MTHPVSIAATLAESTRETACNCGATFSQWRFVAGWLPLVCSACSDRDEAAIANERTAERLALSTEQRQRLVELRLAQLQIPVLYAQATFENFELHGEEGDRRAQVRALTKARRYCSEWPEVRNDILIFRGGFGTGKGHVAWSISRQLVQEHAIRAHVVKLADLVRRLRASWKKTAEESEDEALRFYRELDLLVIDEVSRHAFYGENIHQHLYDVLDHRQEQQRPTILTTNEDEAGIQSILRGALWDRVFFGGGVTEFGEASYRQKRAADRATLPPGETR